MEHADVRYLESKRTVDGRARSRRVRERLRSELPDAPDVLDAGAGTGATLRSLLAWGVHDGTYLGVDRSAALVDWCRSRLPEELAAERPVDHTEDGFRVESVSTRFEIGDVRALTDGDYDLVVAQALLDLVPIPEAMDAIERALRPEGLAYLPITFDGVSLFLPGHPDDDDVLDAYHAAIDAEPGRDSRAGRRLIQHLRQREGQLLEVASSDWIVRSRGGGYPADEAHFLGCVLGFVEDALVDRDVEAADWLTERRRQLDAGGLTYVAHNYDLLYRAPP